MFSCYVALIARGKKLSNSVSTANAAGSKRLQYITVKLVLVVFVLFLFKFDSVELSTEFLI